MPNLLIELFSEEIPARMQKRASEDLRKLVTDGLIDAGLSYGAAAAFATPRRLVLSVEDLLSASKPIREERKGPATTAPDKAVEGFLRSTGLTRDALEVRPAGKGDAYFAVIEHPGREAADIIAEVVENTIRNFPWPKSMRWGNGPLRWVRPLHSILIILSDESGAEVVPLDVDGIVSGDKTSGHRFLAPTPFSVRGFDDFEAGLKRAHVVLRAEERAEIIQQDVKNQAFARGLELVEDPGLLAEVAGLVEWPVVLLGDIDAAFLDLPSEVLQTSMKEHQKFFSLKNSKSGKIEGFATVANMETSDQGQTILAGNQKVLFARLSDAKFFWENDLRVAKAGMADWRERLGHVTFHNKLGTQADRIARIAELAETIAPQVGADRDKARQAAEVAKADLSSEMVFEFPELQGLMGRYYAQAAGLHADIAVACEEHYAPLGPSDQVPTKPVSIAVALADKLDTLIKFWSIDEKPTGSKDPFALRRAALGVIRLLLENSLRFPLRAVDGMTDDLLGFFHDRLKVFLRDQGIRHDVIDACLGQAGNDDLSTLVKRARALAGFLGTDDGENLIQGFKRANNILAQAEEKDGVEYSFGADPAYAETDAEKALFAGLDVGEKAIAQAMQAGDFESAMQAMAALRAPIDAFFTDVQVNADNEIVRRNRLNLLSRIRAVCQQVADLTRIEG